MRVSKDEDPGSFKAEVFRDITREEAPCMSALNYKASLGPTRKQPEYFTPHSAEPVAGATAATLRKLLEPDAVLRGHQGQERPLYLRETLEKFRAEREEAGLGPEDWRQTRALQQQVEARKRRAPKLLAEAERVDDAERELQAAPAAHDER
jgi:hypothetical protein